MSSIKVHWLFISAVLSLSLIGCNSETICNLNSIVDKMSPTASSSTNQFCPTPTSSPSPSPSVNPDPTPTPEPTPTPSPSPSPSPRPFKTAALLFNGAGVWSTEVNSIRNILTQHGASYQMVTSAQLDAMSLDQLSQYGLLIFPGGSGRTQAQSLSSNTRARLRAAVQQRGVSYIGFCAGAFIGVAPAPLPGQDVSYGLGIVDGPELEYYYLENTLKIDISMTLESFPDGSTRDLLWYGGPVTPNIPGGVVAKYPTGEAAITEVWSGKGFVILSGIHPTAPQSVRDEYGLDDSDGLDLDYAWKLLNAGIQQQPLPAFD